MKKFDFTLKNSFCKNLLLYMIFYDSSDFREDYKHFAHILPQDYIASIIISRVYYGYKTYRGFSGALKRGCGSFPKGPFKGRIFSDKHLKRMEEFYPLVIVQNVAGLDSYIGLYKYIYKKYECLIKSGKNLAYSFYKAGLDFRMEQDDNKYIIFVSRGYEYFKATLGVLKFINMETNFLTNDVKIINRLVSGH